MAYSVMWQLPPMKRRRSSSSRSPERRLPSLLDILARPTTPVEVVLQAMCHTTSETNSPFSMPSTPATSSPVEFLQLSVPTNDEYYPAIQIDPSYTWDVWLSKDLHGKSLADWLHLYQCKDYSRTPYGNEAPLKHTRRNCMAKKKTSASRNWGPAEESTKMDDHPSKESHRRDRHRLLMNAIDQLCSRFPFQLGRKKLTDVRRMFGHAPLKHQGGSQKQTGKDDVLVAALLRMRLSDWIIAAFERRSNDINIQIDNFHKHGTFEVDTKPLIILTDPQLKSDCNNCAQNRHFDLPLHALTEAAKCIE